MLLSTARFFAKHDSSKGTEQSDVYADVGSLKSCLSADKLNPFTSHNWIFGELIHADARCERPVLTTLLIGSTSNAISASLSLACRTFRHTEFIFWHQTTSATLVTWYFGRAIRIPFLRAK